MSRIFRDNGLSIVLLIMFMLSLLGQSIAGARQYNEQQQEHRQPPISYAEYLTSAAFSSSVFENWQSEFLQMAVYVWVTSFLFQRGSAESKDPDQEEEVDENPKKHSQDPNAPYPVRAGGMVLKLYENSLSLGLALLFVVSFVLHWISSAKENCREEVMHGEACTSLVGYLAGSNFWFESFQNWQSEFISIALVVILSIFLRQKGSPESKPVHAPHKETGR